ncbi:MAG: signal peptidase I [Clostridium sp.]|nr:signal peptidase I [Acetatifactor muris]MCM1527979.1 signal peptidase I [Bacteroides sp.]MCM1564227.1 signal peptidase I [Clostridium sp.]
MARRKGLSFYPRKKKINSAVLREIFNWIFGIFVAVFIAFVLVWFFGIMTYVVGAAMEPTLYNGQGVLVDRFGYVLSSPKAGDVVVFLPNGNENTHYYVKRVVAVPGDEVWIENGVLYVNGEKSDRPEEKILEAGIAENPLIMGKGEYFCVGDNINNSEDSRSANIGPVKDSYIIGRAWFRLACDAAGMGFVK